MEDFIKEMSLLLDEAEAYVNDSSRTSGELDAATRTNVDTPSALVRSYDAIIERIRPTGATDVDGLRKVSPELADLFERWSGLRTVYSDREYDLRVEEIKAEEKERKEREEQEKQAALAAKVKGLEDYLEGKTILQKHRIADFLNKEGGFNRIISIAEYIRKNAEKVFVRQEWKMDYPSSRRWNRMSGYEQRLWEEKRERSGKKDVYYVVGKDGSTYDLGKTGYDYALWLGCEKINRE